MRFQQQSLKSLVNKTCLISFFALLTPIAFGEPTTNASASAPTAAPPTPVVTPAPVPTLAPSPGMMAPTTPAATKTEPEVSAPAAVAPTPTAPIAPAPTEAAPNAVTPAPTTPAATPAEPAIPAPAVAPTTPATSEPAAAKPAETTSETNAATTPSNADKVKENIAKLGVVYTYSDGNLAITIDQKTVIDSVPSLMASGVLPKIEQRDLNKMPLAVAVDVVGVTFSIIILKSVFDENKTLDKLHVTAFLTPNSNDEKQLCYSFDYSRDMYQKLDFDKLTPKDFILQTPGFTFSTWCSNALNKESEASNE